MDKQKSRLLRSVSVRDVFDLNNQMRRVVLTGDNIKYFSHALPGAWVKVFFTSPDQPEGPGRAYTISHIDESKGNLTLDFVKHGDGPATHWVNNATPGEIIRIAGPREGTDPVRFNSALLFGDETAIPAVFAIMKSFSNDAQVKAIIFLQKVGEYSHPHFNCNFDLEWVVSDKSNFAKNVIEHAKNNRPDLVWGAGEHTEITTIRKTLLEKYEFSRKNLNVTAYWKVGEEDHRDS